jgi:peptidoglycan hydrolase-like protein with peptidoglycan-binding domain
MRRHTIAVLAIALIPAMATAQQDSTRSGGQSGTERDRDNQPTMAQDTAGGRTRGESAGSLARRGRGNMGLDRDQVQQLQQALADRGCDPGTIDGVIGPRTRRAMTCARQQLNITGTDMNELYQGLNLSFGTTGTGTTGTQENQGRVRPPADTAGATDSTAATARSPRAAQEGQGMHDSTTSTNRPRPGADTAGARRDSIPQR